MNRDRKIFVLKKILGDVRLKGDEAIFMCPQPSCSSRSKQKFKLSVNLVNDNFNCWVCHFKSKTIIPILKLKNDSAVLKEYFDSKFGSDDKISLVEQFDCPILPSEFVPLYRECYGPYYKLAKNYLTKRGCDISDIVKFKIGYAESGEYKDRIIFPSFDSSGNLNFFTSRTVVNDFVKYKHGRFNKDIVFNDYLIDWNSSIVITEGVFDAMVAGDNAIPLLGTWLNERSLLFKKILLSNVDVHLALDIDAIDIQRNLTQLLMSYGIKVFSIDLGGYKDVGSMTKEAFLESKRKAKLIDDSLTFLKQKIEDRRFS